ncbi:hypothetical protein BsWGS_24337 [Bradybaena similaris]
MTLRESLACGLQKSVGSLWKGDDYSDFTVVVEGIPFKCHRFILSACSGFFQGLFKSQMKELLENHATLEGMTVSTFEMIINALYTGTHGLNNDNVLDVWSATEFLQINYLTEECQKFVMENISVDTCFRFLDHATLYTAQNVIDHSLDYISRQFNNVTDEANLLRLPFEYFCKVIAHDYLAIDCEEVAMDMVLKWVSYDPQSAQGASLDSGSDVDDVNDTDDEQCNKDSSTNSLSNSGNLENICDDNTHQTNGITTGEMINYLQGMDTRKKVGSPAVVAVQRNNVSNNVYNDKSNFENRKQHLLQLLSACRLFTIKPDYLDSVIQNHIRLFVDTGAHALVHGALMYTLNASRRHDAWPEAAVHRASSFSKHAMVFVGNDKIMAYYLNTGCCAEFFKLPPSITSSNVAITVFNNILYLLNNDFGSAQKHLYLLSQQKTWVLIRSTNQTHRFMLLPHGNYIYCCFYDQYGQYRDGNYTMFHSSCVHGHDSVWSNCGKLDHLGNCLVRFQKYVLVFLTRDKVIAAQCYNTETQQTHYCEISMDGTSEDMTSFSHKENVYLIQRNGSLWKVFSTDTTPVDFELVSKLWDFDCTLKGCVLYREKLFIFCGDKPSTLTLTSLPGVFANLEIINIDSKTPCLPMVLDG